MQLSRKKSLLSPPKTPSLKLCTYIPSQDSIVTSMGEVGKKRKLSENVTPISTSLIRRSSRATRYRGFKPIVTGDVKKIKSKVKPRTVPGVKITEEEEVQQMIIPF